jgi:hypothetical protein
MELIEISNRQSGYALVDPCKEVALRPTQKAFVVGDLLRW